MNQNPSSDASIYDADEAISSTSGFTVNSVQRNGSAPTPLEVLHGVEARMGSA